MLSHGDHGVSTSNRNEVNDTTGITVKRNLSTLDGVVGRLVPPADFCGLHDIANVHFISSKQAGVLSETAVLNHDIPLNGST